MAWAKLSTTQRGYGFKHQKLRAKLLPFAYGTACVRCGQIMIKGQALDFDHADNRVGYLGFSHADCNRRAGARKRVARRKLITTAGRW